VETFGAREMDLYATWCGRRGHGRACNCALALSFLVRGSQMSKWHGRNFQAREGRRQGFGASAPLNNLSRRLCN
jgi:hypothetical protein